MKAVRNVFGMVVTDMVGLAMVVGLAMAMAPAARAEEAKAPSIDQDVKQGELRVQLKDGGIVSCPLKHTDVKADISGFLARVKVKQTFYNPLDEKIEAVYVFPLPHQAAVDDMTMVIGERRIVGLIKRRAEARAIYERALLAGQTAALLEQERPNIFTQSVGNIKPKQEVVIEISYVDVLKYDMGVYEFHFPMVVGPRYIPGGPATKKPELPPELRGKVGEVGAPVEGPAPTGTGWAPDTDRVPDASRITPPVLKPGFRNGHDISLSVRLDAGVPVQDMKVIQHNATIKQEGESKATVKLDEGDSIPNKDFVLRYGVVGKKPELAVLAYADPERGGYFMLMVQPKEDERLLKSPPRELFFLVDVSGSMSGQPIEQSKLAMKKFLAHSKEGDTFQVITFASNAHEVFDKPQLVDDAALTKALAAVGGMGGGGGTEMLKGVVKCLEAPADPKRVRIVVMLTDGYIGNEAEIIGEVGRRCGDRIRFWTIGVGTSVNRFLIDGVAKQGGGMGKVLTLTEDPESLVQEVVFRIHRAQLEGIKIDWGGLDVFETYPAKVPELWAGRPVVLFGRYQLGGKATIRVNGNVEGEAASFPVEVTLPRAEEAHEVLAKVWARQKIEELSAQDMVEASAVADEITQIALDYRLMSQYTSFVAVDESEAGKVTEMARPPRRMLVPVPLPGGVSFEGVFGREQALDDLEVAGESRRADKPAGDFGYDGSVRPMGARQEQLRRAMGGRRKGDGKYAASGPAMPSVTSPAKQAHASGGLVLDNVGNADGYYAPVAAMVDAAKRAEEAKKALEAGKELAKKGDAIGAQAQFQFAYLLDSIAMSAGQSTGETADAAAAEIAKLTEKDKRLDKRLKLLVRNRSLEDALAELGKAGDIRIRILPGSVDDARRLLVRDGLSVTWLDLRGATVREGLQWMLSPLRLSWAAEADEVVVGTTRQMGGPWVYDVSLLTAVRTGAEAEAGAFLAAIREAAPAAVWYAPGQVLVFGEPKAHEAVGKLLADLADPKAAPAGEAAKVHKAAAERYAAKKAEYDKWCADLAKSRVVEVLAKRSWALYAAALKDEVDLESVTELQAAWADPRCAGLLKDGSLAAIRSAWLIAESAKRFPEADKKPTELQALAQKTFDASREAMRKAVSQVAEKQDPVTFVKGLYAAMAAGGMYEGGAKPVDFAKGLEELTAPKDDAVKNLRQLARALMVPAQADVAAVQKVLTEVRGDDQVALAALAARRIGGDTWDLFRRNARDILGGQALSGEVVVMVNRLEAAPGALAARK